MAFFRKATAAAMIAGAGLVSTSGIAFADDDEKNTTISDSGKLIDASDSNNLSGNAILCDIEAVQVVSVEDLAASVPLELLNKKKNSPDSDLTGQSTCNPSADNETASFADNSAG